MHRPTRSALFRVPWRVRADEEGAIVRTQSTSSRRRCSGHVGHRPDVVRLIRAHPHDDGCPSHPGCRASERGFGPVRLGDHDDRHRAGAGGVRRAMGAVRGDQGAPGEPDGFDAGASCGDERHQRCRVGFAACELDNRVYPRIHLVSLGRGQRPIPLDASAGCGRPCLSRRTPGNGCERAHHATGLRSLPDTSPSVPDYAGRSAVLCRTR